MNITASPFYESLGFYLISENLIKRDEVEFTNYAFEKKIKFILVSLFVLLFNSFFLERYYVRFPIYDIESTKIPKSFDGYKIAVVSDLHYGFLNPEFWIRYVIESTNQQNPDLIVGIGDYVKKRNFDEELVQIWKLLPLLKGKDAEVFVNGNHDHWVNHLLSLRLLEESKKSIRNKSLEIKRGDEKIIIGGLGDFWEDHIPIDQIFKHTDPKQFKIALAHNPESADTPHTESIDLFIVELDGQSYLLDLIVLPKFPSSFYDTKRINKIIDSHNIVFAKLRAI
ncbi:Ser/Thr phosphatase family protein [Leptospira vanthielii serovar Holland str. Waz Holland = ATCC 700522]|uniref:Ser/Thr phosphatase family protein n=1 Tax=Leptospira vanthielii serovar Holland str. Waz Holland = ATCC 700522 TaxID=1218591 RepID=N1WHG3_9LEPT|nr:Ser/Thr phosphatase family protein [Leptospira vanthielii serovar Holland str. Waz Holland = ATCC 700522]